MNTNVGRPKHRGHEWVSAIATLSVLVGIYSNMNHFDSYGAKAYENVSESQVSSTAYWNDSHQYGFQTGNSGDVVTQTALGDRDEVKITRKNGSEDKFVKVSFYPDTSIDEIEQQIDSESPRAYSHLTSGIAVIEGDLNSSTAKNILATLHAN